MKGIPEFVLALGAGAAGTQLARAVAIRVGFLSAPNPIVAQHRRPVAYLGGAGVFLGFFIGTIGGVFPAVTLSMYRFILPALLFLVLGIFDDQKAFAAPLKFSLQVVIALVSVFSGNRFLLIGSPFLDILFSTFWILTLVNAYNFIDVCDGLAAGVSVIGLAALAFDRASGGLLPLAACGATVGFLFFNLPPASIFLGDAGSHLLGFLIAAFSISMVREGSPWPRLPEIILISGVALFELAFISYVRIRKGLPWWRGSPDHFSLRLQKIGLTRLQADLCGWSMAALMAITGVSLKNLSPTSGALCLAAILVVLAACAGFLLRCDPS